jgi:hypothetical protein
MRKFAARLRVLALGVRRAFWQKNDGQKNGLRIFYAVHFYA